MSSCEVMCEVLCGRMMSLRSREVTCCRKRPCGFACCSYDFACSCVVWSWGGSRVVHSPALICITPLPDKLICIPAGPRPHAFHARPSFACDLHTQGSRVICMSPPTAPHLHVQHLHIHVSRETKFAYLGAQGLFVPRPPLICIHFAYP